MGRKRTKISDNPISQNLFYILQRDGKFEENIKKLKSAGISREQVNNWINGNRNPQYQALKDISAILDINVNLFMVDPEDSKLTPEQKRVIDLTKKIKNKKILQAMEDIAEIGLAE